MLYENDIIIDGKQRKFFSNETNKVKDIIKAKLEELLCSGQLYGLINSHSGQPPEYREGDSDYYYSRDHSLYKLRKHRYSIDCKEIYNLQKNYYDDKIKIEIEEPSNNPGRHAEEHLCDTALRLRYSTERDRRMTFQICGKKRPCKSCAGRMEAYCGFIGYNQNSGFFFMNSLRRQLRNSDFLAIEKPLRLLLRTPCFKAAKDSWS